MRTALLVRSQLYENCCSNLSTNKANARVPTRAEPTLLRSAALFRDCAKSNDPLTPAYGGPCLPEASGLFAVEKQLSARYWHELAENVRVRAEVICQPEAKRIILQIAEGYATMAQRIEFVDPSCKNGFMLETGDESQRILAHGSCREAREK
jgi:hypothetical protein